MLTVDTRIERHGAEGATTAVAAAMTTTGGRPLKVLSSSKT
jgi:hypothetical protein